jgi:hypothetical protein
MVRPHDDEIRHRPPILGIPTGVSGCRISIIEISHMVKNNLKVIQRRSVSSSFPVFRGGRYQGDHFPQRLYANRTFAGQAPCRGSRWKVRLGHCFRTRPRMIQTDASCLSDIVDQGHRLPLSTGLLYRFHCGTLWWIAAHIPAAIDLSSSTRRVPGGPIEGYPRTRQ